MTQLQHGWGESKLKKKKNHINCQTNANWQWFSPCVVNCILTALNVNTHLSSQPLQPKHIVTKPRPMILIQDAVLTWVFKGFICTARTRTVGFRTVQMPWASLFPDTNSQRLSRSATGHNMPFVPATPGHALCSKGDGPLEFLACTKHSSVRKSWHKQPEIQAWP